MRKQLPIFIMTLLIGTGFLPLACGFDSNQLIAHSPLPLGRGVTHYVGGNGSGNYSTIQEAIDNATGGDTVFVYNGTYAENIRIPKQITVTGEDQTTTTIQGVTGTDQVVQILLGNVIFERFTVIGESSGQNGIVVLTLMQDITIDDCTITGCGHGIWLQISTERITISDSTLSDNSFAGIRLVQSERNIITGNTVEDNGEIGISLESLSRQNEISFNTINGNYGGIKCTASTQNTITNNTISDNEMRGIRCEAASISNTIEGNNITGNFGALFFTASGQNVIRGNNIQGNLQEGIFIEVSNDNKINQNNFINNRRHAQYRFASRTNWEGNYWDNWVGVKFELPIFDNFPKIIKGIPLFNVDSSPAQEPY